MRDLAIPCQDIDCRPLLVYWTWLLPSDHTPLLIGAFGDWIFGAPDGSHWSLDALEGQYTRIAGSAAEFNQAKLEEANRDRWFTADWVIIAFERGLIPAEGECLGWKVHPMVGGQFAFENIQIFSLSVYQALMGQLHRQLRN
ncbi:T6SS immunity protein Tdi1 domain-containing protein [Brevundimonas sp.]|uniref:T6SS immunity protein Tdi1 domain-containing protein n=1 Tax=Brevundimonas sp. TaxID=1871086 RepID=UPI0028A7A271|nr:T6SS immunity protein Tdi1 domain-containing protein [Brevundimonas sp.]